MGPVGSVLVPQTYRATIPPGTDTTIPDAANATLVMPLDIRDDGSFRIADLNLSLDLTFPLDGDLKAVLMGPDGTTVTLFSGIGGTGANFTNTTLDDEAAATISSANAPFSGTFRPADPNRLSVFDGKPLQGTWKLILTNLGGTVAGKLNSWSLTATPQPIVTPVYNAPLAQVNKAILDTGQTTTSTITVPSGGAFNIADLNARLDITHANIADLRIVLSHGGQSVTLLAPGTAGKNLTGTVFDDKGVSFGSRLSPYSGHFLPSQALAAFQGMSLSGTWTLTVTDTSPNGTGGSLDAWSLTATPDAATAATATAQSFRIGFPAQQLGGSYSAELGPDIRSVRGYTEAGTGTFTADASDVNLNAGLEQLFQGSTTSATTPISYGTSTPVPIPDAIAPTMSNPGGPGARRGPRSWSMIITS